MTWLAIYALIKFWLPVVSVIGLIVKAYLSAKKGVSGWAEKLLDNHMTHIQKAAEDASASLATMTTTNVELVATMKEMRADFQEAQLENARTQHVILTGIEVLKDRG